MINLIKNEITKLLHKKSIYIVLIITAMFMVLVSFINSKDASYSYDPSVYYDPSDPDPVAKEMNEYYKKYKSSDWQAYKLDDFYLVASSYYNEKNNEEYKLEYEKYKEAFKNNDWKYFVNTYLAKGKNDLEILKTSLLDKNLSKKEVRNLEASIFQKETEIEMLEYRLKENVTYGSDYLNQAISSINNASYGKYLYENVDSKNSDYQQNVKTYYESKYILDTKEDTNNIQDLRSSLMHFFDNYIFLILVFGVMIAGSIVSEEYNKGTIKSLLITPYKRNTILLSKFITVLIMLLLFVIVAYFMDFIIGGCFLGFQSITNHVVTYNFSTNTLEIMGLFKYILIKTIAILPEIILLITLAFAVSTIIGNTAFAIVITFAGFIASSIINMFAVYYKIEILKYFVTTNWNFNEYLFGATSQYGTSFTHAVIVCIIYFLIMVITSFIVFKRKNIKNV